MSKTVRQFISSAIGLILMLSLVGCGGGGSNPSQVNAEGNAGESSESNSASDSSERDAAGDSGDIEDIAGASVVETLNIYNEFTVGVPESLTLASDVSISGAGTREDGSTGSFSFVEEGAVYNWAQIMHGYSYDDSNDKDYWFIFMDKHPSNMIVFQDTFPSAENAVESILRHPGYKCDTEQCTYGLASGWLITYRNIDDSSIIEGIGFTFDGLGDGTQICSITLGAGSNFSQSLEEVWNSPEVQQMLNSIGKP